MSEPHSLPVVPKWDAVAVAYFLALGIAAFPPTLGAGYLLQLDMIFAPGASYLNFAIAEKGPLYYGRLPFVIILDLVTIVLSDWLVQRIVLIAAIAGSGLAMFVATDDLGYGARFFAGTLYAINPFVYIRLLAGQWYVVLGYAFLPLAIVSFYRYATGQRDRPTMAIVWTTLVAVFDPHAAFILALVGVILVIFLAIDAGRSPLRQSARFGVLAAGVNAYWLVPAGFNVLSGESLVGTIGGEDLIAFSVRGIVAENVPLSVLMLYGFWRGGYTYAFEIVPIGVVVVLFAAILFLAIYGWLVSDDPLGHALAGAAVLGGVLTVGVTSGWTAPLTTAIVQTPIGAGMRETGKFVAIIAVAYAILGGRGIDDILTRFQAKFEPDHSTRLLAIVTILVVTLPLAYTFPMVMGFWGGFSPTEYPEEWHAANEAIESAGDHRILVLPWHQYIYFDWAERTVANPAPMFFGDTVVSSQDPDLGIGTLATDPTRAEIRGLLAEDDPDSFDESLADLGIEYVILLNATANTEVPHDGDGLQRVFESEGVIVFHNEAFAQAPPPEEWPDDGSGLPVAPLGIGAGISFGAIGSLWMGRR